VWSQPFGAYHPALSHTRLHYRPGRVIWSCVSQRGSEGVGGDGEGGVEFVLCCLCCKDGGEYVLMECVVREGGGGAGVEVGAPKQCVVPFEAKVRECGVFLAFLLFACCLRCIIFRF